MRSRIKELLGGVFHPELEQDIVTAGIFEGAEIEGDKVVIGLTFRKAKDPFALKIKSRVEQTILSAYPDYKVTVIVKEGEKSAERAAKNAAIEEMHQHSTISEIKHIVAIASGKGGVGKSTVTSNLAAALVKEGYKVGILDADIYGPSQSKMFGCEGYLPDAKQVDGRDYIVPAEVGGVKLISIAMFIRPTDALLWRGTMANSALRQLIHQTEWGYLDFLLIDLPPGTGDIHLSIINELRIGGSIIVSTPQQVAVADVVRGVEMFRNPNVNIPVLGVVENMAWFTPAELPNNRYYIFGKGGAAKYAEEVGVDLLGEVPIIQGIMEGGDNGNPATNTLSEVEDIYRQIARKVVDKMEKMC